MFFFILSFLSGLVMVMVPLVLCRKLARKWSLPTSFFWKAGAYHFLISILYFGVMGNLSAVFPQIASSTKIVQALVAGIVSGLFFELGRFVALDRGMKWNRETENELISSAVPRRPTLQEGFFFSIGWAGVYSFLVGFLVIINSFGMYFLMNTPDIQKQFLEATPDQIQILQDAKNEAIGLSQGNPLIALTPLIENAGFLMIDIAMTLLIIFALSRGENRYIWSAVFFRTIFMAFSFYAASIHLLAEEAVVVVFAGLAVVLTRELKKLMG